MTDRQPESCGRCGLSTVVDAAEQDRGDADADGGERILGEGGRIEVPETRARRVQRVQVAAGAVKRKLNDVGTRLAFGDADGKL